MSETIKQPETIERTAKAPFAAPECSASDLRTAAKVLRMIYRELEADTKTIPLPMRWWWRLTREDNQETLRKAALLDSAADRMEAQNTKLRNAGPETQHETKPETGVS